MTEKTAKIGGDALDALIQQARLITMSPKQEREQRVSLVYGNTHIENNHITRELVESIDASISASKSTNK